VIEPEYEGQEIRGHELGKKHNNRHRARKCEGCGKLWFTADKKDNVPAKRCVPCARVIYGQALGALTLPEPERGLRPQPPR